MGYLDWFSSKREANESLRKIAVVLSKDFDVEIDLQPYTAHVAHASIHNKKISIGTRDIDIHGTDYYVGLILHEIGHLRHSPGHENPALAPVMRFHNPHCSKIVINMVEDKRVNELMKESYSGAPIYFDALYIPTYEEVGRTYEGVAEKFNTIYEAIQAKYRDSPILDENRAKEDIKKFYFHRTLGLAALMADGYDGLGMTTGVDECDNIANNVAILTKPMADAFKTSEEVVDVTMKILTAMEPLIYNRDPDDDKKEKGEGDSGGAHSLEDMAKQFMKGGHGHKITSYHGSGDTERRYEKADTKMRPMVDMLKRKLSAIIRENDHQKFVTNQKRGLLNKKSLHKTAQDLYRVYKKRLDTKGAEYAVAIVEDCSGSMWSTCDAGGPKKIEEAHKAVSLLARTFRGLGFPTSIVIYGQFSRHVLDFRDRYSPSEITDKMEKSSGAYYYSGDNDTNTGISEALKRLTKVGAGKHKVLVIITDGGLSGYDVKKSADMIRKEEKKGNFSPVIFYVESDTRRILDDPTKEITISDTSKELVPAAIQLLKRLVVKVEPK